LLAALFSCAAHTCDPREPPAEATAGSVSRYFAEMCRKQDSADGGKANLTTVVVLRGQGPLGSGMRESLFV